MESDLHMDNEVQMLERMAGLFVARGKCVMNFIAHINKH